MSRTRFLTRSYFLTACVALATFESPTPGRADVIVTGSTESVVEGAPGVILFTISNTFPDVISVNAIALPNPSVFPIAGEADDAVTGAALASVPNFPFLIAGQVGNTPGTGHFTVSFTTGETVEDRDNDVGIWGVLAGVSWSKDDVPSFSSGSGQVNVFDVMPEPSAIMLLGTGMAIVLLSRFSPWRRRTA